MLDYAGNNSQPNDFSIQLLQNLQNLSGAYPIIRAGGTTSNRAIFVANQSASLIEAFSASSPDQPSSLSIGPTWIQSFQQFPKGTKYIYGLNFGDGDVGLQQTILEATNAFNGLGTSLESFEIGNEVDGYHFSRMANSIFLLTFWKQYAAAIADTAIGATLDSSLEPLFQACAFEAPRHLGYNATPFWNVENALKFGIASTGKAKTVADHDYMGSACPGAKPATIKDNLLNHFHMTSLMYYHSYLGNYSSSVGIPYVLGETNSISCQGQVGVSDVYAAALWSIDYTLYIASLNASRIYYHMGTPYRYSAWQPVAHNGTEKHVKPLYYGNIFTASAFAGGNKKVSVLVNETDFSAYGIYDSRKAENGLESVVMVNLEMWNSTQAVEKRPYTKVKLPELLANGMARRLTSPGVEIVRNISFAGQYVDGDGRIVGRQVVEVVESGEVLVGAGEAVLVSFS
ncbi:hypothetical protein G7Y89_g11487 [Cudoniella acicularis]|uniref:Beta-glucuronidase C-terminal domain-containing protein n=1 Tax=Cudoniella acicularis TaxID=354080 RepID=A0A8H4RD49_9HELO|nr:hypothetical protein G7Y89_g11487 [Cudoniella acicularis]